MIGVPVFKLYLCLVHIETKILKLYPDHFGKTNQESKATEMKKGKRRRCIKKEEKEKQYMKKIHDIRCTQSRLC